MSACRLALLGDAHGLARAAGGLGVLAAHGQAPVVAKTAVGADLLKALEVVALQGEKGMGGMGQNTLRT